MPLTSRQLDNDQDSMRGPVATVQLRASGGGLPSGQRAASRRRCASLASIARQLASADCQPLMHTFILAGTQEKMECCLNHAQAALTSIVCQRRDKSEAWAVKRDISR